MSKIYEQIESMEKCSIAPSEPGVSHPWDELGFAPPVKMSDWIESRQQRVPRMWYHIIEVHHIRAKSFDVNWAKYEVFASVAA